MDDEKKISIDELQDKFDHLVLTFFDSVRSELGQPTTSFQSILESHQSMLGSIRKLNGIDCSPEIQINRMQKVSERYEESRIRVLKLEEELKQLGVEVDRELEGK